jgi:hypothetical protein
MSEMIERVAKAAFTRMMQDAVEAGVFKEPIAWEQDNEALRAAWRKSIRAAIEAMPDADLYRARPFCDWREDHGNVLWWRIPISEPPYCGTPLDLGRKESHEITEGLAIVISGVNAWPFDQGDERHLWWTPLPNAKRIEDQVPL